MLAFYSLKKTMCAIPIGHNEPIKQSLIGNSIG